MSFHQNFSRWLAMTNKENCPVCQNLPMPEEMVDIFEFSNSWLSAEPVDCLKGACHLTIKQHVVELFDLGDEDLFAFMKEVRLCAKALKEVTKAVKINYEIHGNSLPHLHVHLYPRYIEDPFPGKAIDYHQRIRWYSEDEFKTFTKEMRESIFRASSVD